MNTELLNPQNSAVIFIDHQPQMMFGVASIDRQTLFNNVILLAKAASIFKAPRVLTTVETKSFSGNMWPQLLDVFPGRSPSNAAP
jgi:nicotinamidase-related amidase